MSDVAIVPISDPNRGHRRWRKDEIYTGPSGTGAYVPNEQDEVWDWVTGLWRVASVNRSTGLSQLVQYIPPNVGESVSEEDILLGVGPGYQSESYRVYLDTSVIPHVLAVDSRLRVYGSSVSAIKVFWGTDISDESKVISAMYDQGGTLLGENIPLELVQMPNNPQSGVPSAINYAVKTPMVGYTSQKLPDNEVVTVVMYDDVGNVTSIAKLLIMNTAFIRTTDASKKFITSIHLESPFISEGDDSLLKFAINMPVEALNARGVVTYSDGSKKIMPVDGTKFNLYGLQNFIATIVGQKVELALSYKLSSEEYVYGASASLQKHLSAPYWATTTRMDGAYSVKLFCFPQWVDGVVGYKLRWFLFNLNRSDFLEVTNLVTFGVNSNPFDPISYGPIQRVDVGINMNEIDSSYSNWRHSQSIGIALLTPGNDISNGWNIEYTPGQPELYGKGLRAITTFVNVNNWKLKIDCGLELQSTWLKKVFYNAEPLVNTQSENAAPEPNHFVLMIGTNEYTYPIDRWNTELLVPEVPKDGEPLFIRFIRRLPEADLQLGMGGMITLQVDATA
ncbi:hypothetical protein D3C85_90130 [compost metagenome]